MACKLFSQQRSGLTLLISLFHPNERSISSPIPVTQETDTKRCRLTPIRSLIVLIPYTHFPVSQRTGSKRLSPIGNTDRCRIRYLTRIPQIGFLFIELIQCGSNQYLIGCSSRPILLTPHFPTEMRRSIVDGQRSFQHFAFQVLHLQHRRILTSCKYSCQEKEIKYFFHLVTIL